MRVKTTSTAPATPPTDLSTPGTNTTSSKDPSMRQTPAIHRPAGSRPSRLRRLAGALGTLASLTIAGLALGVTPALADNCPNAALRAENNSTRLPECRAYEMVTPLYKEGFPVLFPTYSDEGSVAYSSPGSFAGSADGNAFNAYLATRSAAGWSTEASGPPEDIYNVFTPGGSGTRSGDLRQSLWSISRRDVPGDEFGLYLRGPDGSFTRIGDLGLAGIVAASADLSHVVFWGGFKSGLSEYVGTNNEGPPATVNINNTGQFIPDSCPDHMSPDGRVIIFTAESAACDIGAGAGQVWARVGGTTSVEVSRSECTRSSGDPGGACNAAADAVYAGAASDGSRVFFTATQQLVNGDTDQTNDLYECDIPPGVPAPVGTANPCSSLTEVSHNATGANVENVVHVSEDGSRVYFVAQGALASNLGTNDAAPVVGDNNLYVWEKDAAHPAGQTTFVAKLEANDISSAQSTADGRYLVFDTSNRLLASDTDEATDVYRYDAGTGALLRLSTDTSGTGGNAPGIGAELAFPRSNRPHAAMSDDGSTIVFETTEALSPADTDAVKDVYEWREGQVSLISNGGAGGAFGTEGAIGITPSGRDIFFLTKQPLTAGDSGTEADIYDARVGGGLPVSTSVPCSGEACQGAPAPQPQPPGTSASAAFNGPGSSPAAEAPPANPKPKSQTAAQKLAKALKACRSKHSKKKRTACEKRARNTYRRAK